jgi:outer membrane protein
VKNFSIILNIILAIAIIVLYVLHFSGPKDENNAPKEPTDSLSLPADIAIAYILEDSLLSNYDYFIELAGGLEKQRQEMENDYTLKAQGLQKEIEGFQRTAGNMTMNQARAVEEDLVRKRQNLMMLQEKMGQDLMKAEADVNNKLYDKVTAYLEDYAKDKGYSIILNMKRGNAVLYGHQGMDITDIVLKGLNENYKLSKGGPAASTEASDSTSSN